MGQKGLLVVSFGTTYKETREKTIDAIEESLQAAFPEYKMYRAFTSKIIKRNLENEGFIIYDVKEALEQMIKDGITGELLVQPTHIINGIEFDMMCDDVEEFHDQFESIRYGTPLLTHYTDYKEVAHLICEAFPVEKDEALVLMGHGSEHHANAAYPAFEYVLKDLGYDNVFVGTVEGYPELPEVTKQLEKHQFKKVCLVPMMIVAGDHANNDMIGEEDSWKVELEEAGYETRYYLKGLGEIEGIRELFIKHAKESVSI